MCLGIPGRVAELDDMNPHLAMVEITGARRRINIGLLEDEGVAVGDWVLIHVGFAMSVIDEDEAQRALDGLRMMGVGFDDELAELLRTDPPVSAGDVCITCGDVAVALEVVTVHGSDATCRAADGGEELVAIDLVAPVSPGDHLLVHARVALGKVPPSGRHPYQGGIRLAGRDAARPDLGTGA